MKIAEYDARAHGNKVKTMLEKLGITEAYPKTDRNHFSFVAIEPNHEARDEPFAFVTVCQKLVHGRKSHDFYFATTAETRIFDLTNDAKLLALVALRAAKKAGATHILATAKIEDSRLAEFFQRLGFVEAGENNKERKFYLMREASA